MSEALPIGKPRRDHFGINGVYKITNNTNNYSYVGSCSYPDGIYLRIHTHLSRLRRGVHENVHLQRAFNKEGESSFYYEILEVCEPSMCIDIEQKWIDDLKPEYNFRKIARSNLGIKYGEEVKKKFSEVMFHRWANGMKGVSKPVINLKTGEKYRSKNEAAKRLGIKRDTIDKIINNTVNISRWKTRYSYLKDIKLAYIDRE